MKRYLIISLAILGLISCKKTTLPALPQPEDIGDMTFAEGYVDMGLSVKWAADNLGAATSCEDGDYYCWGCTEKTQGPVKETEYKYISQYTGEYITYGIGDELKDEDDVVIQTLGGNHRLPTYKEALALAQNCNWKYVRCNGTVGFTATSKLNGAVLFFPCCGYYAETGLVNKDISAHIWTREVSYEYKNFGYGVSASPLFTPCLGQMHRYLATNVRAIEY